MRTSPKSEVGSPKSEVGPRKLSGEVGSYLLLALKINLLKKSFYFVIV